MDLLIRRVQNADKEEIVRLSLSAWEPVFTSFAQIMGSKIFSLVYPDWQRSQREAVEEICDERGSTVVWVAERGERVIGFVACKLNPVDRVGEVEFLAVDPAHQNGGVGTALSDFALVRMQEMGMKLAVLGTGGDESHAPARRTYEKSGYTGLPLVRYYKDL